MNLYQLKLSDMIDALEISECPFCFLEEAFYKLYFSRLLNSVLDEDYREEWNGGGGFCATHSQMLLNKGSATGQAILYQDLLKSWQKHWLSDDFECPVCAKVEKDLIDSKKVFVWGLTNSPEFVRYYKNSSGLCKKHFTSLYKELEDDSKQLLVDVQENAFKGLGEKLELLLRQHDYNYQGPKDGESLRSWKKAARYYTGGVGKKFKV